MPAKSAHAFMAGFFVGRIMDYSKMKKAQLIEEIEALQERIAEPKQAQAERLFAEQAGKRAEEMHS